MKTHVPKTLPLALLLASCLTMHICAQNAFAGDINKDDQCPNLLANTPSTEFVFLKDTDTLEQYYESVYSHPKLTQKLMDELEFSKKHKSIFEKIIKEFRIFPLDLLRDIRTSSNPKVITLVEYLQETETTEGLES